MTLTLIVDIPQRKIFFIEGSSPASFLIADDKAGGVLINSPQYSNELLNRINEVTTLNYLFLPSHFGDKNIAAWKKATKVEIIAHEMEVNRIESPIDITVNHKTKLSRTIEFVPMGGRTPGSCALFLKNLPGVLFLGPILSLGDNGWPSLIEKEDDASFETRMFGALGLKNLKYDYVFTDDFSIKTGVNYGPKASEYVEENIDVY